MFAKSNIKLRIRIFCISVLLMICLSPDLYSQSIDLEDQLILYLPFNGNADDESGSGLNATVNGASLTDDRHDNPLSAYYFDGSDDYIELGEDYDYPERSVCFWFKADEIPLWINGDKDASIKIIYTSDHPFMSNGLQKIWVSNIEGQDKVFFHNGGAASMADYAYAINKDSWTFVAVTVTPELIKYYVNGILQGTRQYPGNIFSVNDYGLVNAALGIGRVLNHRYFEGIIDDVYIYSRAINACEVYYLYSGELMEER